MPIRVRIRTIDTEGFTGRDPHPPTSLAGQGAILLAIEPDASGYDVFVYTCRMDDGHIYEFVEHELDGVELV